MPKQATYSRIIVAGNFNVHNASWLGTNHWEIPTVQLCWLTWINCLCENPHLLEQCGAISVLIGGPSEHLFAWPNIVSDDMNQSCTALTNIIKSGMVRFIPNKTLRTKLTDPAWWSPECSSAIKKKARHGGYTATAHFLQISKEHT